MKSLFIALVLIMASVRLIANDSSHEISSDKLKEWFDQKKPVVILDARSKQYFDGKLLPGAKWLPCDATDEQIVQAVPSKETLIVVYCLSPECPASRMLAEKLKGMGYKNVYEYSEGIQGWLKKGYPTDKDKQ